MAAKKKLSKKSKILISVLSCIVAVAVIVIAGYKGLTMYNPNIFTSPISGVENVSECTMIAHRGLDCVAPENTLAAYKEAANAGYEYAETDIQLTKDGKWVICHDDTLNRTTDMKGAIRDLTLEQVRSANIDFGSGIKDYPDEKIPTLEEFLDLCAQTGLSPVLELKLQGENIDFSEVVKMLEERNLTDTAVIISFYDNELRDFRELCPSVKMYYLCKEMTDEVFDTAKSIENCDLDIKYKGVTEEGMKKAEKEGLEVAVWTVDSERVYKNLYDMGIRTFTTNCILPE